MRLPDSRGQLCLAALALYTLTALNAARAAEPPQRPRIGLVLAGGGAKGGAHVGVLKVLEELRVPIDCIAGTSMGALVGGGYASGQSAAEIEKFVTGIDWKKVVGGVGPPDAGADRAEAASTEANTSIELGFHDGAHHDAGGLADSSAIDDLLRTYVARARLVEDFNKLPIPFRAVATDMITGNMVVLDHGDLAIAMRASMAIPGAFSPVVRRRLRPFGRRHGPQHPGRRRAQYLRGHRHRRQSRRAAANRRETGAGDAAALAQHGRDVRGQREDPAASRSRSGTSASTCRWATSARRISSACRRRFRSARRPRARRRPAGGAGRAASGVHGVAAAGSPPARIEIASPTCVSKASSA